MRERRDDRCKAEDKAQAFASKKAKKASLLQDGLEVLTLVIAPMAHSQRSMSDSAISAVNCEIS